MKLICLFIMIFGTACVESEPTPKKISPLSKSPQLAPGEAYLDQAQPKLRTLKLWLGSNELTAEIAISQTEIATGMMYRTQMAENEAMLFVFSKPHRASFYMRNTLLPLSCACIDRDGKILEIRNMTPKEETPIVSSSDQVQFVLEVNQGWFERHNVSAGMFISSEKGTLAQVFLGK